MKKNVMMRLASALLVLVLLTTCAISATFAKYTATNSGSDFASVAKWGVKVAVDGSLFEDAYKDNHILYEENEQVDYITVQAAQATNLVAPGTRNEEGMTFVLTGTPEVDVDVSIVVTGKDGAERATDVVLLADTYIDYTEATGIDANGNPEYENTFTLDEDYHPLVFTLTSGDYSVTGTLLDIESALESRSDTYHTNTDLSKIAGDGDGTYTLTWAWDFNGNDAADTYLSNVIAGMITDDRAVTDVCFDLRITVTQVD